MANLAPPKAVEAILDAARWAPSGDNAQPWRFRVKSDRDIDVLIQRANPNIYEYRDGEPTLISAGGLLENIQIAAPAFGLKAGWQYAGSADGIDRIAVHFSEAGAISQPDLFREITRRSVDRRAFKLRALSEAQKRQLAQTMNRDMAVQWYESCPDRLRIARLSALATTIRLSIPETFAIHRSIVDWDHRQSEHAIPSQALGIDPVTLLLTRWSMASWDRTRMMNALGAPAFASLQMDFLPGFFSGAYFAIRLRPRVAEDAVIRILEAGQAVQRFWLTATKLGLVMQPCVAILAFWSYAGQDFTVLPAARKAAAKLATKAQAVLGAAADLVFLGRIGWPASRASSRSVRLPLATLLNT